MHLARSLSSIVAVLMLAALAPPASASNTWSDTDPIVVITTPGGHQVAVYVDNGTNPADHVASAQLARMTWTAKSVAGGNTKVALTSTVPCDVVSDSYPTRYIASSGPYATGEIYTSVYGVCGQAMTSWITLNVP